MSWARLDDRYDDNPKIKRAWRRSQAAVGLHVMAISYASRHETDGLVDAEWFEEKIPNDRQRAKALEVLVGCGLLEEVDGDYLVHDFLDFNPSKTHQDERRGWDRKRKALFRDRELVAAIRRRDGDNCRYCGEEVNWADRKSPRGGTYDHVQPRGENSLENVVVACHGCNSRKGARTPEEAGLPLLPVSSSGSDPDLDPDLTRSNPVLTRAPAGSGRDGSSSTSSQGETQLTRELLDQAIAILNAHWPEADEVSVMNVQSMYPLVDLLQGCRLAVAWASDPTWEMQSLGGTLVAAMKKLDGERPEVDPHQETKTKRLAALRSGMGAAA